jgi:GWxTD domain-containing protein
VKTLIHILSFLAIGISISTFPLHSSEIFDPFSRLEDFLRYKSDHEFSGGDVGFYVDLGYLAEFEKQETQVVLMVSIPESELRFIQEGDHFFANYRLSFYWKNIETGEAQEKVWNKRIERPGETEEVNAIHKFRTVLAMRGGRYKLEVEVEDRNDRQFSTVSIEKTVPDFLKETPSLSTLFLHVNPGEPRERRGNRIPVEELRLKALCMYPYATERVAYYFEGYGIEVEEKDGLRVKVDVIDSSGTEIWSEVKPIEAGRRNHFYDGEVDVKLLGLGGYMFRVSLLGPGDRVEIRREKPFYVTGNDRWLEDHFEFALEFLRHIASQAELEVLKSATEGDRMTRWREFWEKRDPFPATPVNEGQVEFYRRLKYVNQTFSTHIEKGWLTDRGRVYLSLGPPDEVIVRPGVNIFGKWETWIYDRSLGFKVILYFEDRGFTDDYRLVNPGEFIRARSRLE